MAYYFMVESKKGEYVPLNIKKSKYFPMGISKYKKENACGLDEIDQFTILFNDEIELRRSLIEEGILQEEYVTKPLSVRFLNKNRYSKVMYDFLYQRDLEYIASPEMVVKLIMERYYQNDMLFIQKFANSFSGYYECSTTAPEVARLAEVSIRQGNRHRSLDEVDLNRDIMLARLVKLLILKHYELSDGRIIYKNEVNYKNLHSVIAFINHYNDKDKPKIKINKEDILTTDSIIQEEPVILVKPKKRMRKKIYNLPGQLNFEELL